MARLRVLVALALLIAAALAEVAGPALAQDGFFGGPVRRGGPGLLERRDPRGEDPRFVEPRPVERRGFFDFLFGPRFDRRPAPDPSTVDAPVVKKKVAPRVKPTIFVAVLGDSFAENLANGLTEQLADRPDVSVQRKVDPEGGYTVTSTDWVAAIDELVAGGKATHLVLMMGMRDIGGPLHDAVPDEAVDQATQDALASRLDAILTAARSKRLPVVVMGLPPVAETRRSTRAVVANAVLKEHAALYGATFVDVWESFVDQEGGYTNMGPNVTGRVVKLRTDDGFHFNRSGSRKLAFYAEQVLRPLLVAPGTPEAGAPTIAVAPAEGDRGLSPILILSEPARTPGAVLAGGDAGAPRKATVLARDATVEHPGRADDFAWPRRDFGPVPFDKTLMNDPLPGSPGR